MDANPAAARFYGYPRDTLRTMRITDLNDAQGILSDGVISVAMDLVFLTVVVVFLMVMDWRLATVSLFTLPLYGIVFYYMNPRLRQVSTEVQAEMEEMSGEAAMESYDVEYVIGEETIDRDSATVESRWPKVVAGDGSV